MNGSVTLHMDATVGRIWNLVSDVTKIGRYSPETFEAEWLDGATGPAQGARFRGHVKRNGIGPIYWTTCRVTESLPDQVFAFQVELAGKAVNTWRYEMRENGGGTDVTESFELPRTIWNRIYWSLLGRARGRTNREGMLTTLERIKTEVEHLSD